MASSSDIYFITDPEEWVPPFNFRYSYLLMDDQDLTNAYIFGLPISGHAQQIINAFTNRAQEYSDQIIDAFEKIKFVINIDPELDTSGVYRNSTIHFATSSSPAVTDPIFGGSTAGLMLPLTQVHNGEAKNFRDVWLVEGGEMFQNMPSETVILHEILHALSLKHPQIMGIHILDDRYTVMSYNQGIDGRYNQNLGVLDILAIQSAYSDQINWGANLGSTTYQFSTAAEVDSPEYDQEAIWDAGGGQDIIDASNQTQSVVIDLRQGSLSDIDSIEGRNYNIGIAFGAVIENANGSDQSDVLIGNVASNNITGGDGDDRIFGDGAAYISNGSWLERWSLSETSTTKEEWHYAAEINGANPSSTQTDVDVTPSFPPAGIRAGRLFCA